MKLRAHHTTTYLYSEPVSISHTEVRLMPRLERGQRIFEHNLTIEPPPEKVYPRKDFFGNDVVYFSIHEPHRRLNVQAETSMELEPSEPLEPQLTPPWEEALSREWRSERAHAFKAYEFSFESPRISLGPEFAEYAQPSFPAERPLLEAALDLSHRIYSEFRYDPGATTVTTPVTELLAGRSGVCQDFAHFAIACLRSLGLAARYVSGYLGTSELIGSQASHAWLAVFCPGFGWLGLDPTNDRVVDGSHISVAYGRDYSDVAPVKGIAIGGGEHAVNVAVRVEP